MYYFHVCDHICKRGFEFYGLGILYVDYQKHTMLQLSSSIMCLWLSTGCVEVPFLHIQSHINFIEACCIYTYVANHNTPVWLSGGMVYCGVFKSKMHY